MSSVFFYVSLVGFMVGIFTCSFFDIELSIVVWGLMLSLVVGVIWSRRSFAPSAPYLLSLSLFILFLSLGLFRMDVASWGAGSEAFEKVIGTSVKLQGVVVREPDERASSLHLYTKVDNEVLLVTTDRFANIQYGDELVLSGMLSKPVSFETDLGRTFNYPDYLQARGVSYMMRYADIEKVGERKGNPVIAVLLSAKQRFISNIERVLTEPYAGLAEGLLLGVKRALGEELEDTFRKTGIIHIVVLSGYNIMLVVAFVMYIFSFFMPRMFRIVFGFLAICAFALIVGLSATVVRACIMAGLVLFAQATGRTYAVMRALMIAGVVMLIINPYLLAFDVGFQLSFVATLGLILVAPFVEKHLKLVPTAIGIREFLTATIATQIFVTPLLLYQIGQFSVIAVLVNVLVLPMVPAAMLLTFIAGCIAFFSVSLASLVSFFAYLSLAYIINISSFFGSLPFASFVVPAFPFLIVVLAYLLMSFALYHWYIKKSDTKDILKGWTIEEEVVKMPRTKSVTGTDTPVFFR